MPRVSVVAMRLLLASTLLAAAALLGCTPEGRCAIDSDCPLRSRCVANMCTPIGATDAGESNDTNASIDARMTADAPGDAPVVSDANADAPIPDAPVPDAPFDAAADAPVSCPTYAATQSVSNVRGCTGVTVATVTIMSNGMPSCGIDIFSRLGNIDGSMSLMGGTMTGGMTVGDRGYPGCTLMPGMLRAEHLLACGACTLTLTDTP